MKIIDKEAKLNEIKGKRRRPAPSSFFFGALSGAGTCAAGAELKHAETVDKSAPKLPTAVSSENIRAVVNDVSKGVPLKHAETVDKAAPVIEADVKLKKIDRGAILNEVRPALARARGLLSVRPELRRARAAAAARSPRAPNSSTRPKCTIARIPPFRPTPSSR